MKTVPEVEVKPKKIVKHGTRQKIATNKLAIAKSLKYGKIFSKHLNTEFPLVLKKSW